MSLKVVQRNNDIRIHHAMDLLTNTQCAVQEISAQVGYTNWSTFLRAFRKRAGTTPRTQESGYTCASRPITVPGLSTLFQPISAKSPSIAPNFLRPVS